MTFQELAKRVRELTSDSVTPYRWSDEQLFRFLKDGIGRLNNARPESRYIGGVLSDIAYPDEMSGYELPSELLRWAMALAYYAAGRCLELDSSDTINQSIANDFMSKAEARFMA